MKKQNVVESPEHLFGFILRARILIVGREILARSKSNLQFILITGDISENSRQEILEDYKHYPVVQHYTMQELEKSFGIHGTRVVGFKKSGLAQSLYASLKAYRINKPSN